jgi:predicted MPP superfamily phosphohydrolase
VILPLLRLCGLYGPGRRNALALTRADIDLGFPDLPLAFDGYRLLHISDPHLETLPELADAAAALLAGETVDLTVLTGDFQRRPPSDPGAAVALLERVLEPLTTRDGIVATLGNHDTHAVVAPLEALGITVLINEAMRIERAGETLTLCGTDDVARYYTPDAAGCLQATREGFGIALVHTPELAQTAAAAGFSLYLAGHTHGGQVCLPGGRPIVTFLETNQEFARGLWRCGDMIGYTTSGLGSAAIPVRFACPPEVVVFRLRRMPAAGPLA